MIPYPLDASLANKSTIAQTPQARANWTTKVARILSQLRTDPQKPEKWRLMETPMHIFLQKWGSLSQTSKPLLDLPLTNNSVVLEQSFEISSLLSMLWTAMSMNSKVTWGHLDVSEWLAWPGYPWQTANRHLLLGQFCQVQTLRPKTQQLCRDSQLRHHTPLQLHLRLNDMSVWPRSSKKAGENQPQTRNSAKVDVYSRSVRSPHGFKDSNFWLTSQPAPGAEASWLCAGRAPAVPTMACPTARIPRLWSPGPSLRMGCCGIWSPIPSFQRILGGLSWSPVSLEGRSLAGRLAASFNQSLPGLGLGLV